MHHGLDLLTRLLLRSDTGLNGLHCLLYALFLPECCAYFLSSTLHFLIHAYCGEQICYLFGSYMTSGYRLGSHSELRNVFTPELLIGQMGNDDRWFPGSQARCGGSCSPMMN